VSRLYFSKLIINKIRINILSIINNETIKPVATIIIYYEYIIYNNIVLDTCKAITENTSVPNSTIMRWQAHLSVTIIIETAIIRRERT